MRSLRDSFTDSHCFERPSAAFPTIWSSWPRPFLPARSFREARRLAPKAAEGARSISCSPFATGFADGAFAGMSLALLSPHSVASRLVGPAVASPLHMVKSRPSPRGRACGPKCSVLDLARAKDVLGMRPSLWAAYPCEAPPWRFTLCPEWRVLWLRQCAPLHLVLRTIVRVRHVTESSGGM